MCGIVGYVGKKTSIKNWVQTLKKLEYRGYDSAGVAFLNARQIEAIKQVGQIDNLLASIKNQSSKVCICHTRWATHGMVNTQNAHPQLSPSQKFAVVHNGIIENYAELKEFYKLNNLTSQTDTEIVAAMLEKTDGTTLERLTKVTSELSGSYALAVMDKQDKFLYVAKNKSPLYVSQIDGGYMVASDISCFTGKTYYYMSDRMVAKLSKRKAEFYKDGRLVNIEPLENNFDFQQSALNGYKHFMAKEIDQTSGVINNICLRYQTIYNNLFNKEMFKDINQIYLVGCGTAYHACQMGAVWLQQNLKIKSDAHIASEFRYSTPMLDKNSLVMLVSQSGETADTLAVAHLAKNYGAQVYGLTNVEHSTLASLADKIFPLCAGPEIAVASTKAYSAMLAVLYIIANYNNPIDQTLNKLRQISLLLNIDISNSNIETISKSKRIFFIGRGCDGISASEGALKLKEVAYLDACGYCAGELKHGTIALIEPNVVVIAIITNPKLKAKTLSAVEEVLSRGATVVVITDDDQLQGDFSVIKIPKIEDIKLKNILAVIPMQKLAYSTACLLGNNPDKPRNLAKSVTVE